MQSKDALRVLASLFIAYAFLYCVTLLLASGTPFLTAAFVTFMGGVILATFYHFISAGSATGRILLIVFCLLQSASLAIQTAANLTVGFFVGLAVAQIVIRLGIIALVLHPAIWRIRPEPIVAKPRPASETHEHDWKPHELLNDWIRCGICGEMHIEPGTVALVNRR